MVKKVQTLLFPLLQQNMVKLKKVVLWFRLKKCNGLMKLTVLILITRSQRSKVEESKISCLKMCNKKLLLHTTSKRISLLRTYVLISLQNPQVGTAMTIFQESKEQQTIALAKKLKCLKWKNLVTLHEGLIEIILNYLMKMMIQKTYVSANDFIFNFGVSEKALIF